MVTNQLISEEQLLATVEQLKTGNIEVRVVETGAEALAELQAMVPAGASVMTGSSTTLDQIGFSKYLSDGDHNWSNLHQEITNEADEQKRSDLRRKSVTADYYLASANAVTQTGVIMAADATGSRVGAFLSAAKHLVLVVGTQKIVPDLVAGFERIRVDVFPLEDKRSQAAYGVGSSVNKWAIIEREGAPGRTTVIFVKAVLGY